MTSAKPVQGKWSGHCLCGGVAFTIDGAMSALSACHCAQCRRQSGHFVVAGEVADADITFQRDETLAWYRSSDFARRGFCQACGSALFWQQDGSTDWSVSIGSLEQPNGLRLTSHIFVAHKGGYYQITDGLPQAAEYET